MGSYLGRLWGETDDQTADSDDEDETTARTAVREPIVLTGIHAEADKVDITRYDYDIENLALEGGGNKGMAYVGALRVMEELGITVKTGKIKRLVGTSSGSMVACLLAIGFNSYDIEKFLSMDLEEMFLDSRFGFLSFLPNILSKYGWNPGDRINDWFGEKIEEKTGDADISFLRLYKLTGIELCVVVTNLSQMTVEYCHPKTSPDMSVRTAVRMSMAFPVIFAPVKLKQFAQEDMFTDGGLLCNYPIHAYDGWWLSLKKEDGFFTKVKGIKDLNCLLQQRVRFGTHNPKTLGMMLYADSEDDLFRARMERRVGTKLYLDDIPDTDLGKTYKQEATMERKHKAHYDRLVEAVDTFLGLMAKYDLNEDHVISKDEFEKVLSDPSFTEEYKERIFGKEYKVEQLFEEISKRDDDIDFSDLLSYLDKAGLDIQSKMLGYRRCEIDSFGSFIASLQSTLSTNVGRLFMQPDDVQRTIGINTGHVATTNFKLEEGDRKFMVNRGRLSAESYFKYRVIWNELKPVR